MIDFVLPKEATRIWDLYVPYVKTDNTLEVYLQSGIDEPDTYSELCYVLSTVEEGTIVNFHNNTPGGVLDSAFQLAAAIKACKGTTVAHLTGTVASAGTIIALVCDKLEVADHTSFMIHNYSAGTYGKGNELKARQEHIDKSTNEAFREFYYGFLTDKEIKDVINGQDKWFTASETRERWLRKQANATIPRISDTTVKPTRGRPRKSS